ncbi:glutathione S-transferase [Xylaria sp. FL0043]|nr:glutathione S-transferase [Xylaria sp. FL0043]
MAPFGTIWTYTNNPRVHRALIVADMNGLEIDIPAFTMRETNQTPEFLAKFPLGKVPAFEGADGFRLTESIAIASYIAQAGPKAGQLLGEDAKTRALITQWSTYAEGELFTNSFTPLAMAVFKYYPMNEGAFDFHVNALLRNAKYLETVLQGGKKHLVGDKLTMADLMVTSFLYSAFQYFLDAETRKELPNLTAYIQAFAAVPEYKKYYGELQLCETRFTAKGN